MECEICQQDIGDIMVILPIRRGDGALNILACLGCAKKSSAYCLKHDKPHLGFEDGSTACRECIEELVAEKKFQENFFSLTLENELPDKELNRLLFWASEAAALTCNFPNTCILRALATKALRSKQTIEKVIEEMVKIKSVSIILP